MGEDASTAPVLAEHGRQLQLRGWAVVVITLGTLVAYQILGTWSAGGGLGGSDANGHWLDAHGTIIDHAPPTVDIAGRPAPIAVALIVLAGAVALLVPPTLARHGHERAGRGVRVAATWAMPVLLVVAVLVFAVWQQHVVMQAITHQNPHPPVFPFGGTTTTIGHMTR